MKLAPDPHPGFKSQFTATKVGRRNWVVAQDLVYVAELPGLELHICVPVGFKTDLASIPRPLWFIVPPDGSYTPAAVVHDYLYRTGLTDRATADRIFIEAMKHCGTWKVVRGAIYATVRAFGWMFFNGRK